jgi:hypothetical protein
MELLNNEFFPITTCFGFLEADLETVIQADINGRLSEGGYTVSQRSGSFPDLLRQLLPLTGSQMRDIWIQTSSQWTAYFDNCRIGGDPLGPICHGALDIGCRGVMVLNSPETSGWWGGTRFAIFSAEGPRWNNITRDISAINDDGRWHWGVSGTPQPFEELDAYKNKRIRDRLTPAMLQRYCAALGIHAFDEAFYGNKAYLVENNNIDASRIKTETIETVRKNAGV